MGSHEPDAGSVHLGTAPSRDPAEVKAWALARYRDLSEAWERNPDAAPPGQREWYRQQQELRQAYEQEVADLGIMDALESIGYMNWQREHSDSQLDDRLAPVLVEALPHAHHSRLAITDALRRMRCSLATPALLEDYWRSLELPEQEAQRPAIGAAIAACMSAGQRPLLIDLAERLDPTSGLSWPLIRMLGKVRRKPDRGRVLELFRRWLPACPVEYLEAIGLAACSLRAIELLHDLEESESRLLAMTVPPKERPPSDSFGGEALAWVRRDLARYSLIETKKRFPRVVARLRSQVP
jgi:hypothetical protein